MAEKIKSDAFETPKVMLSKTKEVQRRLKAVFSSLDRVSELLEFIESDTGIRRKLHGAFDKLEKVSDAADSLEERLYDEINE